MIQFRYQNTNDEVPDFSLDRGPKVEAILLQIQQHVFGVEVYKNIYEKAGALFYLIAKNHVFLNGNKRMAVLTTDMFLRTNNIKFTLHENDISDKCIEVVNSDPNNHQSVLEELSKWIQNNSL